MCGSVSWEDAAWNDPFFEQVAERLTYPQLCLIVERLDAAVRRTVFHQEVIGGRVGLLADLAELRLGFRIEQAYRADEQVEVTDHG